MKKSKILSSALVMGMVSFGAYAADEMITGGAGTCTADVLGVSDNNATANTIAVWSINEYTLNPGEYLNVTETSVDKTQCPAGSYCVGGTNFTVDNAATSIATCPAEYPNSATGAGAQNQCYTACTVATANIAHATAVGGNDYFGDGADACYATDCDTGYHVDGDIEIIEKTPVIPVNYGTAGTGYASIDPDGSTFDYNADIVPEGALTANGTWAVEFDYGVVYGKASCQPQIKDAGRAYIESNLSALMSGGITVEEFRTAMLPLAGQAKTDFAVKVLQDVQFGKMSMEDMYKAIDVVFGSDYDADYQTTDIGQYCYCQMDGFSPITDGVLGEKSTVASAPWVFISAYRSADNCASWCADRCASLRDDDVDDRALRAAVFGALGYTETGTCAANTINIDWNPDNGGAHTQNMCTYDGSITLPDEPVKVGYTFSGWKLVEPNSTPVQ